MVFNSTTVRLLFRSGIAFQIPVYQRAYSWNVDQWRVFLEDLVEGQKKGNTYSLGNLLLETIKKGQLYDIIDGQQRITTIIIFMRAMINVIRNKKLRLHARDLEEDFIKSRGTVKLQTVDTDKACFNALIVENKDTFATSSPSQTNILEAKRFFTEELLKMNGTTLGRILDFVLDASINQMEMQGKKESALMFELQNNRGKDLTNLEKLKSFFMYQMYVHSLPAEINTNIDLVADYFKSIYTNLDGLGPIDEDSLLRYHCFAYLNMAFAYRNLDDIVKDFRSAKEKVKWIKDFTYELNQTFSNIKELSFSKDPSLVIMLEKYGGIPPFAYAFIIKGLKHFKDDASKMARLYRLMEVVVFRVKLIGSRADFNSRMSDAIKNFNGDVDQLATDIETKLNDPNSALYWSDNIFKQRLEGDLYQHGMLHQILWEYEASLVLKGYVVKNVEIIDESIEHISPQTPTDPKETIASGYDVDNNNKYSQTFIEKYLNCVGNLLLISRSHNSVVKNVAFSKKVVSYNSCKLLLQQLEIADFVKNNPNEWKARQIEARRDKIVAFCMNRWKICQ